MSKSYADKLRFLVMPDNEEYEPLCDESVEWNDTVNSLANFYETVKENWCRCPRIKQNIPIMLSLLEQMEPEIIQIYNERVKEYNKEQEEEEAADNHRLEAIDALNALNRKKKKR